MQCHNSTPYPPPDVHPAWASTPASQITPLHSPAPPLQSASPPPSPDFLIVCLFALRLARKLIQSLDSYPERLDDIRWLDHFLDPYDSSYDLAKIAGSTKMGYTEMYPEIVARMRRQQRYPFWFMAMNPVTPNHREALNRQGEMTAGGSERVEIINFADAAREWGSTVLVPQSEARRMLELADQRRVADLGKGRGMADRGERRSRVEERHPNVRDNFPSIGNVIDDDDDYFPGRH
ncbi:hypothetical protein BU25DRAFT_339563 [Macroventuria anomochaeta]|uniref:Uncharacterized protein n=1 Tax=Macroventuria anomochaeta TaxID=301207 RepID=A0ACB6S2S8_9PLEO|nr:uncharacterized protein BU25DRAFT_339563 [Macroventuria anomochaeta]KAF2628580.1 hypothetical protein BU25DRAFT_339563 [Macroventuria anomochaeta]